MSILKFLQVIEQALPPLAPALMRRPNRPAARRRPMRLERLELRAVLDGDSSMMPPDYAPPEEYYPPEVTSMPPDYVPPEDYSPFDDPALPTDYVPPEDYSPPEDPSLPPDYTPPEDYLPPEEPTPPEYTPPEETPPGGEEDWSYDLPPYFYDVTHHYMGGSVVIQGFVGDDMPVGGLTVYISTDQGHSLAVNVDADGYFTTSPLVLPMGTQVLFYTVDSNFNYSDSMLLIV